MANLDAAGDKFAVNSFSQNYFAILSETPCILVAHHVDVGANNLECAFDDNG